jgi:outer membrane protein assembly factor BamD
MMQRSRVCRLVLIAVIMAALVVSGCGGKKKAPKDPFAGQTAEEIYQLAVRQMEKNKYGKARTTLQAALGRSTTTPEIISKVHLALADAYFYDGGILNLAEALSRYTNFLTFYPNHDRVDYAQYQIALCHLKQVLTPDRDQTQTQRALDEFLKLRAQYPNSQYVEPAEVKANEARELLAESEFRIGQFYFKNEAYEGAIDRFRLVLEHFPLFSKKPRLYLLLGRSLLELDREAEGRLYLEKLVSEFPESDAAYEAATLLEEAPPDTREGG